MTALRERLRHAIVTGEIPASAAPTQAQLAALLGVSRTPLREALRMLELEQLIIREPNGRVRAADLSAEEIEQLGIMRITLEAAAVRLTVPELTNADHATLEGLHAETTRLARVGEWGDFEDAHRRFHRLLTCRAGAMHAEQLRRLWEQETRYRRAFEHLADADARDAVSLHEHRVILDAAEARDSETAARLIAEHHGRAVREVGRQLDDGYAMDRLAVALAIESGQRRVDVKSREHSGLSVPASPPPSRRARAATHPSSSGSSK